FATLVKTSKPNSAFPFSFFGLSFKPGCKVTTSKAACQEFLKVFFRPRLNPTPFSFLPLTGLQN
ncbi:hypothetical protein, partial [Siphonobacter aquaeclarae]|uniref:hypothetical protein n=1 Tax=Siphonobacter aquaeclarae TaxID=563176 RepID=UPI001C40B584